MPKLGVCVSVAITQPDPLILGGGGGGATFNTQTEAGENLITEAGDKIKQEQGS